MAPLRASTSPGFGFSGNADRLALQMRLSQRLESEWTGAVAENRRIAHDRGITDETIERAIHRRRYGQ
jgi:hypothetical protein